MSERVARPGPSIGASPGPDALGAGFRGDIDGLRALAILVIVGFHAGLAFLPGGFIGVDVFFVISGYLITRNLLGEVRGGGRVGLTGFWARRVRRLVPALALMLVVVLALALLVLPSLQWQAAAAQARAAALYVSNIVFAFQATDYFAEDLSSSLFLHTWSLGVEEQFYLVWPLLVAGAAAVATRARRSSRAVLTGAFASVLVVSLVASVVLTQRAPAHAFFGLPTRAWEFAAAGLLAVLGPPRWLGTRAARTAAAVVGLALIAVATVTFGAVDAYPGAWPLIPVVGTLALIIAGSTDRAGAAESANPISAVLASAPLRAIGRVSYSWYLWHWPLILLAVAAFDDDSLVVTGGAALVALGVGAATHVLVENPVRFSPGLTRSWRRTYAMGAAVTVLVLVVSIGVTRYSDVELAEAAASSPVPTVALSEVRESKKRFECQAEPTSAGGAGYCLDGDVDGDRTVMVIGDSHARHWKPAFAEAARERGVRLVLRWRSVCPAVPVRTVALDGSGEDLGCQAFRAETDGLIDELRPDAVVSATSDDYGLLVIDGSGGRIDQTRRDEVWGDAYRAFATGLADRGIAFGTVVDTPRMPADPLDCVAEKGVDACAVPAATARTDRTSYSAAERRVRDELGGRPELDVNDVLCDEQVCPVVVGGTYAYVDLDHLYEPFVLSQVPAVGRFLDELLG